MPIFRNITNEFFEPLKEDFFMINEEINGLITENPIENMIGIQNNDPPP